MGKPQLSHGEQIKLSSDKSTIVKQLGNNEEYGKALPLLTIAQCSKLPSLCAVSLVVCIQEVSGPRNRATEGGDRPVSNLLVAFEDRKIDVAFWGRKLANAMGHSKSGDVYRLDWMTILPLGQNLFKFVSNRGTNVEQVHGADADKVRGAVHDTLVSMSPQFGFSRSEKMKLRAPACPCLSSLIFGKQTLAKTTRTLTKAQLSSHVVVSRIRARSATAAAICRTTTAALSARKPHRATVHALATAK